MAAQQGLEIDAVQKLVEAAQKDYKDALDKAVVSTDALCAKLNAKKNTSACSSVSFTKDGNGVARDMMSILILANRLA